jgi:hypothetical protein
MEMTTAKSLRGNNLQSIISGNSGDKVSTPGLQSSWHCSTELYSIDAMSI